MDTNFGLCYSACLQPILLQFKQRHLFINLRPNNSTTTNSDSEWPTNPPDTQTWCRGISWWWVVCQERPCWGTCWDHWSSTTTTPLQTLHQQHFFLAPARFSFSVSAFFITVFVSKTTQKIKSASLSAFENTIDIYCIISYHWWRRLHQDTDEYLTTFKYLHQYPIPH